MNGKKNILLIGIMGCGKTTIGKILSQEIAYDFIDMDTYIEEISNQSISDLFSEGEENFRNWETEACRRLINKENTIISTGGGVIKKSINMELFKGNSIVIFIDRPIESILKDIDTSKRPLLSKGKEVLYKLKEERDALYNKYCDYKVVNDGTIKEALYEIIKIVKNT